MTSLDARFPLEKGLAHCYPDAASARRVASYAGLDVTVIDFSGAALTIWHAIVSEAEKSEKTDKLLDVVLVQYSSILPLANAYRAMRNGTDGAANGGAADPAAEINRLLKAMDKMEHRLAQHDRALAAKTKTIREELIERRLRGDI